MTLDETKALVILSGGQDSTTCLFWAIQKWGAKNVRAISFDYGQRHRVELTSARMIAETAGIPWVLIPVDTFRHIGGAALIDPDMEISQKEGELPNTFVPGRNLIFITFSAAFAYRLGIKNLVTGVCEQDYSGYPDCRSQTIVALNQALDWGMDSAFTIHTPLMHMRKSDALKMAWGWEGFKEALAVSHTCYEGKVPPCGKCPACILRANSFLEAGLKDPLIQD